MGLVPVAFETQHTVPRLMGGFANAERERARYWTVATTQRLKRTWARQHIYHLFNP